MFARVFRKRFLFWLAVAALVGCAQTLPAQVPTAYKTATPSVTGQMYMESMYLPSATTGPWGPAWSPDGKSLVFSMYGSLWVIPAAGGQAVQITAGPGYDSEPAWSPDGARIVFSRDTGHAMELWVVNADGSSPSQLTANSRINVDPEWHSADTIFFTSSLGDARFGIWQVAAGGGEPSPVLAGKEQNIEPASSPDGKSIVLISSRQDFANPGSPAFARMSYGSGDLWKLGLASKKLELLDREETLWQARPRWSPDGHKIVYVSYRTGSNQLWLLDPDTGIPVQLTYLKDAEAFTPAWSPDSRLLAFVTNGDHRFTLWTMAAVGGQPRQVRIAGLRYRQSAGQLQATVLDERGRPTPARIYLVAADGRNRAPANSFQRESVITGDSYFESDGRFSLELPAGTAAIEAVKGFEYLPAKQSVQIRPGGTATVVLRLKRMTDLAASGWVSGDNHMHMNYGGVFRETPASLMTEIEAEDLNVLNAFPTNNQNRLLDMQYFIGRADPHSTANNILYFNEEYRPNFAGHMDLLRLERLFFPVYDGYPGTPFAADYPSNAQVLDSIHAQGGIGGYAHPYLIPRGEDPEQADFSGAREFPADAALGKVDFYDLMCVWTDKYVAAEVWYRLLNLGFRVPISSGSDVMTNYWRAPTVGSVRVYVHAGPRLTYAGFIDAMLKGRGFVTNGPLVSFTVDGKEPGAEIERPAGGAPLEIKAEAWSLVPMDELDIIENGKVVYSRKPGDAKHLRLDTTLPVEGSAWIAARVTGPSAQHLLMDSYVYAHTDPVYVGVAGRPLRSPEDARYFIRWMDRSLELINQRTFDNPEEKQQVREVYQQARARFVHLAGATDQAAGGTNNPSRND